MIDVPIAPIDGFYDHNSYEAAAIDVSLFILIIGGFLGLVTKTGAIDAGIERVTARLGRARRVDDTDTDGAVCCWRYRLRMAEESLPFYTLLVPVMMAARFDPLVAAVTVVAWRRHWGARFND
ncbi:hypothetical protein O9992_07875 [Vibrio lentus]|nr:hypothetical protein [Vibrio lentus]